MAVRQDKVQLQIDFITDESRALAKTLLQTKQYNDELAKSKQKIEEYRKVAADAAKTDAQRAEAAAKLAAEEKKVADNLSRIAVEGKKVENLDLSKVTPAQLVERARQLNLAIRQIPQSAPEFKKLTDELQRVKQQLREVSNSANVVSKPDGGGLIGRILGVAGGVGLFELVRNGINAVRQFASNAIAEVDSQLKADAQIREAIRSTSGAAGRSLAELKAQAEALQEVTLFSDDQTEGAQALLLTFTNIRGEIFDNTIPLLQDVSTRLGVDLNGAALQVGKALNDPVRGLTALRRVGVSFSEEQERLIKKFVETNRVADAQKIILKELETEFGGSARAAAEAGAGGFQLIRNTFGEIKEAIGGVLLGIGTSLLPAVRSLAKGFLDLISVPVSQTLEKERQQFNGVALSITNLNVGTDERTKAINRLKQQYPQYLADIDAEKVTNEQLQPILTKINQSYIVRIALQKQQEKIQPLLEAEADAANRLAENRAEVNIKLARAAELTGVNIAAFKTEGERAAAVLDALEKKVASQGSRGIFQGATEEGILLGNLRSFESIVQLSSDIQARAANKVTDAERIRQQVLEELKKTYGDLVDQAQSFEGVAGGSGGEGDGGGGGVTGKLKEESNAAAGSLADLRKRISDLKTEIENAPNETKVLQPLIDQLKAAERALAGIEEKIAELKNPTVDSAPSLSDIDQVFGGPSASTPTDFNQAQLDAIIGFNDARQEDEELTIDAITLARLESNDDYLAMLEEQAAAEERRREEWKSAEIAAAESVSNAFFQIQEQKLQRQTEKELAGLQAEYDKKLEAAEGNSREQERLQKELERKKEAIEREAARKRKALALKEAIVEGALAILKALPNAAAAFAAGIAAAAQIAIISKQQFARGGYTGTGYGPRDSSGYRPAGIVHEGEYVAPKWQVNDPTTAPVIRWLENRRLRGYASGGLVSSNTTPTQFPPIAFTANATLNNLEAFTMATLQFANTVAAMPKEVKATVVYTEIETAESTLSSVRSGASI